MKNLRSFLKAVQEQMPDEICVIEQEIDPRYEVTAFVEKLLDEDRAPILLFKKVKGFPFPLVCNVAASRKLIAFGLQTTPNDLVETYRQRESNPIKPYIVTSGPVQEVVRTGEDVNLFDYPHITAHESDPGPYITGGLMIAKHPETGIRNVSYIRCQIVDKNTAYLHIHPGKHMDVYHKSAEKRGVPLEVAVVVGAPPSWAVGSLSLVPIDVDEIDVMGAMAQQPIDLVKCKTVDLEVMADGEMVFEGEILPDVRETEGPFGEFTGYAMGAKKREVLKVKAVTHRKDAIYQAISSGATEHCILPAIPKEAYVFKIAKGACPTIQNIHVPFTGRGRFHYYISIDKQTPGQPRNVAMAVFGADLLAKHVFVVDKDIDIFDERQVLWALATRVQGDRDIIPIPGALGSDLDPSSAGDGVQCKLIIDATAKPSLAKFPVKNKVPEEILAKIRIKDFIR
jgi:2,5-furandicarboxylate decarboxylase 1